MKYLRHINESNLTKIFKDNIDWNIIDDAKDMSLEYLDENVNNVLIIEIKHEMYNRYMRNNLDSIDIYSCTYRYKNLKEDWDHEENLSASFIEKIDVNNIKYNFYIYEIIEAEYQDVEKIKMKETYEIQERLKSLYHDKINDIIEERNGNYRFARSKPLKNPYDDKLHESVSNNEIILTLREILLDLEDVGYEIVVDSMVESRIVMSLGQKGFGYNPLNFFIKTEEIRNETILRILDYIDQCGWKWISATNEEGKKNWNISYVFGPKRWINK